MKGNFKEWAKAAGIRAIKTVDKQNRFGIIF